MAINPLAATVWWQPIVDVERWKPPFRPPPVIGGELFLRPVNPAVTDLAAWWDAEVAAGRGVARQIDLEIDTLDADDVDGMDIVPRWHLNLHPAIPPIFRDLVDHWRDLRRDWPLVWELDWDRPAAPELWMELEGIRNRNFSRQWIAANHVGRQGLKREDVPALWEQLAPYDLIKLDRAAFAVLTPAGHLLSRAGLEGLRAFIDTVGRRKPIIAVGVETDAERNLLRNLGVTWMQGRLFHPGTPLRPFFQVPDVPDGSDESRALWLRRLMTGRLYRLGLRSVEWWEVPWWVEDHPDLPETHPEFQTVFSVEQAQQEDPLFRTLFAADPEDAFTADLMARWFPRKDAQTAEPEAASEETSPDEEDET